MSTSITLLGSSYRIVMKDDARVVIMRKGRVWKLAPEWFSRAVLAGIDTPPVVDKAA